MTSSSSGPLMAQLTDTYMCHDLEELTHWGWDKMDIILQTTFWNVFLEWKYTNFDENFTEICSWGSQCSSFGLDNGLVLSRQHAIIRTWLLVYWCTYVSLSLKELIILKSGNAYMCQCHLLTQWRRVTYICVDNITSIGSENGLLPGRRQSII